MAEHYFQSDNVNDLYVELIDKISKHPQYETAPRGFPIKETTGVVARLTNPLNCLITIPERKLNYAFAAVEKLQYLTGQTEPDCLIYYNSNFGTYKNDYGYFDGAYPERMSYWYRHIYELLKADPDTRQAVMTIYGPQDRHKSKDIPCTVMFHFMIREGKLNMIVYMRSNDLLWGFPYDTNGFCFVQQAMAAQLGVDVGYYELHAGSLHIYTEREEQLTKLLNTTTDAYAKPLNRHYSPVPAYNTWDDLQIDLKKFWIMENDIRTGKLSSDMFRTVLPLWLDEYVIDIRLFVAKKDKKV